MRLAYFYLKALPAPKAAPIQFLNTCHAIAEKGVDTTVYLGQLSVRSEEELLEFYGLAPHAHLRIVALRSGWPVGRDRPLRRALAKARRGRGRTVILGGGLSGESIARVLGRAREPRDWRFVHELDHLRRGERHRAAVAAADGLVCISNPVAADLQRLVGIERPTLVLPTGTRVPSEPPSAGHRDVDVLFAGKLGERQGIRVAVAAMRFLPASRLLVLGGAPDDVRAVREYAQRLGVADRVVLDGFVPPAAMPAYLARARVGVCPYPTNALDAGASTEPAWNGSSMKLLELMAYGVPAVATDIPSIRDVATHDLDVWLVEPDSPEALSQGIRRLLDDSDLAARLVAAGRKRATEYSWERRAERLLEFLASL